VIIGIDLGTTNSLVACINREGKPEIIINERGSRLTPSVVYFKNDQEVLVGELARSQLILQSDRTISAIKRHMGEDYTVQIARRSYSPRRFRRSSCASWSNTRRIIWPSLSRGQW
jgi:molecular chaperone DnaK